MFCSLHFVLSVRHRCFPICNVPKDKGYLEVVQLGLYIESGD